MTSNLYATQLAKILTEYSAPVKKGDLVVISGSTIAEPLLEALYEATVKCGGHPHLSLGLPNNAEIFYTHAQDHQLDYYGPLSMAEVQNVNVYYSVRAAVNTKRLSRIDAEKLARSQKAGRPGLDVWQEREKAGELIWCIAPWPTQAAAQDAEMGLQAYENFVFGACGLFEADPIAYWTSFRDKQLRLTDWLKGKKHAHVKGPGIDMTFEFEGRTWVSCHGERNFPDGEIFTSPIEDSVNGHVEFNFPTVYGGRELNGVKLTFKDGIVVDACAAKNEDYLFSQLNADEGAKKLGEFAIGTNMYIQEFTREILFDEKIGGTIHMALGRAFPRAGGLNQSSIHWDMVHGMRQDAEITVDGNVIYRNGAFVI